MLLTELKEGEFGIIDTIKNEDLKLKLLEMGCLPGEKISIDRVAPLGDPIAVNVFGYVLSLRKSEAASIEISRSSA
jgi:ferrous iron transport protein A